jgi:hypothetical protein
MSKDRLMAKRALLRVLDRELDALTGRFLSEAEQLRVLSLGQEIDVLQEEIDHMERNR